ncbi:hypothetical protein [Paenibacillus harenae]|uniref:hypothetical protein n=1 Tax=Paenibacillus harenae TaxID=306543 RepID=UPI00048F5050|nr:hypothetical protein [Paenibacillus harenae]
MKTTKQLVSVLNLLIIFVVISACSILLNEEQMVKDIIDERGYETTISERGVSFQLPLKEEWIPDEEGEILLNHVVIEMHSTTIVLEKVNKLGDEIIFEFGAKTHAIENPSRGELLHLYEKNDDLTYKSESGGWVYLDKNRENISDEISNGGAGQAPFENRFWFKLHENYTGLIKEGLIMEFSGFFLYNYEKLREGDDSSAPKGLSRSSPFAQLTAGLFSDYPEIG